MADIPTQAEVDATFKNLEDSSRRYISANFRQDGKAIASTGVAVEKHRDALKEACTAMIERLAELEAALCAFAPNNIKPGHWAQPFYPEELDCYPKWKCRHCDARADEWQRIEHSSDCPVVLAVALLPSEAHDD